MVASQETNYSQPSLMDLNDDCLAEIVAKLNLLQQFRLSRLHVRLKNLVESFWRTHLHQVDMLDDQFNALDDQTFVAFLQTTGSYMQKLIVKNLGVQRLRLLSDCSFVATKSFEWMEPQGEELEFEDNSQACQFNDEDLLMLQRLFPNLKRLKLVNCQITGKYIEDFAHLQHISLEGCHFLESDHLGNIFDRLNLQKFDIMQDCDEVNCCDLVEIKKCASLQHIKIADYHLCFDTDIINDILRMPRLRKLSIYSKNFVFDVIERISRNRLKTITAFKFNGVLHNFGRFFIEIGHMQKLQKLCFYNCHRDSEQLDGITNQMLLQIARHLNELREIHFCSCDLESEIGLLHFVANCKSLNVINIVETKGIKESFIWKCIELLRKQKERSCPLELWIKHTDIDSSAMEDPRYIHHKRLIRLDFKKNTVDTNPAGVLKFTFSS